MSLGNFHNITFFSDTMNITEEEESVNSVVLGATLYDDLDRTLEKGGGSMKARFYHHYSGNQYNLSGTSKEYSSFSKDANIHNGFTTEGPSMIPPLPSNGTDLRICLWVSQKSAVLCSTFS